jgi:hypothetical protein
MGHIYTKNSDLALGLITWTRLIVIDMTNPLFYILAPFVMAFALFAAYLVISILLGDPLRPFRMFSAQGTGDPAAKADQILDILEAGEATERDMGLLVTRLERLLSRGGGEEMEPARQRYRAWQEQR